MVASSLAQQLHRNRVPAERRTAFGAYAVGVLVLAGLLTFHDFASLPDVLASQLTIGFWLTAALAIAFDAMPVSLPGKWNTAAIFPSIAFTFAIMLVYGVAAAVIVQTLAVAVSSLRLRHAWWRAVFNVGQYTVAFGLANLVHQSLFEALPRRGLILAVVAAALTWFFVKYLTTAIAIWLRDDVRWWPMVLGALGAEAMTTGSLLLLAPALMMQLQRRPEFIPLIILPLIAVRQLAIITAQHRHLANVDPLTGLANRKALIAEVTSAAASHSHRAVQGDPARGFAIILLDLDRFKNVNDALGHEVGDRLLVAVGDRLAMAARPGDLVARLGGDEFAVVAKRLDHPDQARALAERIEEALLAPVVLDGLPVDVGGSIGIALFPEHGSDFATLLRRADVAMYSAKHAGDGIAVYAVESDQNSPQRLSLLADLRAALAEPDGGGLSLVYQPQIEIASGEVVGIEALLRWLHPTRGPVNPEELIKVAEPTPVMRLLTRWVLEEAVQRLAMWSAAGMQLRVAVNVSVRDLHTGEIVEQIEDLLRRHRVAPSRLQLEITESALMADPNRVVATLTKLHQIGVGIALDDFGTGYSSMQHLRRLPLSEVKIDRSFVMAMADDADDRAIVRSIIELAGALGLRVVAEGVEDERAWRLLHLAGCDVAQGWFFAHPQDVSQLPRWLAETRCPVPGGMARLR
ncbi:MAG TPA: GGDEF-domain containing protein [Micromonosporaceae bacterium]|nr:GGDEF-domain containing protein [Micromonosporaceae bacterium]